MRCISPISIKDPRGNRGSTRVTVPCNKCGACQLSRRSQWSFRLLEEFNHSTSASFVTLTYSENTVPKLGLDKKQLQLFIKKLRNKTDAKIRYYAIGEYGTKTNRPHYHAIIYNGGNKLNENIQNSWTQGKKTPLGLIHCGSVNAASIHYITKYHVNYQTENEWNKPYNRPFAIMSRNPGIGHQYKERAGYWNKYNGYLYVINNGFKQSLPRYYKTAIFNDAEKEKLQKEALTEADIQYIKEFNRLVKLGYQNPTQEIDNRLYQKSQKVKSKAEKESKF